MIIYWKTLEKDAGDVKTISEYMASVYFPYVQRAKALLSDILFRVYLGTTMSNLALETEYPILFDFASYNPGGHFNLATHQFTAPVSGFYHFETILDFNPPVINTFIAVYFAVNVGVVSNKEFTPVNDGYISFSLSDNIFLTAGDVISVKLYFEASAGVGSIYGNTSYTFFSGYLISAA